MKNSKLKLAKSNKTRVDLFLSFPLSHFGIVSAQIESSETHYEKALEIFYEARRHQSLGAFVKALQKYEDAFHRFQEISNRAQDPWQSQARKRMNQIQRDVQRLEMLLRKEPELKSMKSGRYEVDPRKHFNISRNGKDK